ncbi:MAG: 3-deoxy-D-manno-octulosonic acid transferase [Planctomycetes bacterium]|nr:3-deoxy-D-manno-octulosonic acid transferase [Planctomycetota bacterium]
MNAAPLPPPHDPAAAPATVPVPAPAAAPIAVACRRVPAAPHALSAVIDLIYAMLFILTLPYYAAKALGRREMLKSLIPERLGYVPERRRAGGRPCLWVHAVSVGEVIVVRTLVRRFRERHPDWEVVVSTITETGQEVARKSFPDLQVFYFPLDLSAAVRRCLRRIRPDVVLLAELEIWPNFILHAHAAGVRVAVVNGRVTERSLGRYLWIRGALARILACIDALAAQDEVFAVRLRAMGTPPGRVVVTGNMKFDAVVGGNFGEYGKDLARRLGYAPGDPVWVGGSTHEREEEAVIAAYRSLRGEFPRLRLVLVPRHPERCGRVEELLREAELPVVRKSRLDGGAPASAAAAGPANAVAGGASPPVLLVDTVGELRSVYSVATVVFVGGSLIRHGGQNLMEPAALGKPVVCGPHMHNFAEGTELLVGAGGAVQVADARGLAGAVRAWLADPAAAERAGAAGARALLGRAGATERNLALIERLLAPRALA